MKSIIALFFIMGNCGQSNGQQTHNFLLNIWDYNYSMAYTTHYKITNDSIVVTDISSVQNETNKVILCRSINGKEKNKLNNFLFSFPLDRIATEYKNRLVLDGDQKRVEISIDNKNKKIEIANFYQKDLANLFNVVNQMLEKDLQIKYRK